MPTWNIGVAPGFIMSSLAAVLPPLVRRASWRWMTALCTATGIGIVAVSWQPAPPIRPSGAPSATTPAAAAPAVSTLAARHPAQPIEVILSVDPGVSVAPLVRQAGGRVTEQLPLIGAVVARVSAAGAMRLATDPGIRHVSLNAAVRPSDTTNVPVKALVAAFPDSIRATKVWNDGLRATGRGVTVAVLDTGIAGDLPDFKGDDGSSRVIATATVNPDASGAADAVGHGTHVAGLIAGDGSRRPGPLMGKYIGAAPDANLVSVKISDDQGGTTLADVIDGLQFAVAHKTDLGIKVVNLSLNSTVAEPAATDPLDAAVEVAWANGITVVAAAGNRGTAPDATWYAPANDPYVVTIGAVDDGGSKALNDDAVTNWSSRGPTQSGLMKPDVLAPGYQLPAPLAPGAAYAKQCPACVADTTYLRLSGTSMAAAVASGAAADILQVHPTWTPDQVKGAMMTAFRDTPGSGVEVQVDQESQQDGRVSANAGNTPSTLLPSHIDLPDLADWTRMSFTRMSFTRMSFTSVAAGDPRYAAYSRMSFTCDCRPSTQPTDTDTSATADPSRMSFTRMSFTRMSFTTFFSP